MREMIRGISVCNPVDIDRDYLLYTVNYAIAHKMDHMQFIGPIHNPQKGNIDGMTLYRKYAKYNAGKDLAFLENTMASVNEACELASKNGIKTYVWHHELELPAGIEDDFPEMKNADGDVEVTHPIVKDFLVHKLEDFFAAYPKIDGLVLTLHETRIPLLKLKNQKLDKIERVKYVTEILYNTCVAHGKELIVRPFASLEEDYAMMMKAYEDISTDLLVMDKWTQFDWSLCLPHNKFYDKIKKNPLLVETDIFGEFFGKGRLPLMLKQHILDKFAYCEAHNVAGYCSRIDRAGRDPFGEVNEVNINIMNACMNGQDVDAEIKKFYEELYPGVGQEITEIMEPTEEILRRTIYLKGYYYSELSAFPQLNHSKNHFYFEMMQENYAIASNEWFIPIGWDRGSLASVFEEKDSAVKMAADLFAKVEALKGRIEAAKYENLWTKFMNLKLATAAWQQLTNVFYGYARYFETGEASYKEKMEAAFDALLQIHKEGSSLLKNKFYCAQLDIYDDSDDQAALIPSFVRDTKESFAAEDREMQALRAENALDFVICGGAMEGHKLQKEVNFSDSYLKDNWLCRIPGTGRGSSWSTVNAHGWFSYEIKVRPNAENKLHITVGSATDKLCLQVTVGNAEHIFCEAVSGRKELVIPYTETEGKDCVRIRFDRKTKDTPYIYTIVVK